MKPIAQEPGGRFIVVPDGTEYPIDGATPGRVFDGNVGLLYEWQRAAEILNHGYWNGVDPENPPDIEDALLGASIVDDIDERTETERLPFDPAKLPP